MYKNQHWKTLWKMYIKYADIIKLILNIKHIPHKHTRVNKKSIIYNLLNAIYYFIIQNNLT